MFEHLILDRISDTLHVCSLYTLAAIQPRSISPSIGPRPRLESPLCLQCRGPNSITYILPSELFPSQVKFGPYRDDGSEGLEMTLPTVC